MKAYITCPCSHSQKRLDLLPIIESVVKKKGIETFIFKIGGEPSEIFERDYSEIKSGNIIVAEVSELSIGVGIEIGMSYCLGLKRILLHEKGTKVTKLAQGMPETAILEYETVEELKNKLSSALDKCKSKK
jgi:hypothetical protein